MIYKYVPIPGRPCLTISVTILLPGAGKIRFKLSFRLLTCGVPEEQTRGDMTTLLKFPKQLEERGRR